MPTPRERKVGLTARVDDSGAMDETEDIAFSFHRQVTTASEVTITITITVTITLVLIPSIASILL